MSQKIMFEDHGQDFIYWQLDETGKVIDCQPFQQWLWEGAIVLNHQRLAVGIHPVITKPGVIEGLLTMKYPIEKIVCVE